MPSIQDLKLTYQGEPMDSSPAMFGALRPSCDATGKREELWRRFREDGYLFLPGYLDRQQVAAAGAEIMERMEAIAERDFDFEQLGAYIRRDNPALDRVLHQGPMIGFYEFFLGGPVRYFDYTWFRSMHPHSKSATPPHYDGIFMNRGTKDLYTSWTPFCDIPIEKGGIILLEGSHKLDELIAGYGQTDVDLYCETEEATALVEQARREDRKLTADERQLIQWNSTGAYPGGAIETQRQHGGRWLTADYRMGDLLVFGMHMMHASHDNQTEELRISTDSRYQLASEPVDERWVGDNPSAHSIHAKRGTIC